MIEKKGVRMAIKNIMRLNIVIIIRKTIMKSKQGYCNNPLEQLLQSL